MTRRHAAGGRHRLPSAGAGPFRPTSVEDEVEQGGAVAGGGISVEVPVGDAPGAAAGGAAPPDDIGARASRGILSTLAARWGRTVTLLVSSVVLARLLTPDDFGLVAMLVVITTLVTLFQDLGLTTAVVRARSVTAAEQSTVALVNVGLGVVLTTVLFLAAPLVAAFYGRDELVDMTRVLSFTFVIASLSGQARALLQRELRFGVLAVTEVVLGVLQLVVAVSLALLGFRYWSLVVATLVATAAWTLTLLVVSRLRWTRPAPLAQVRTLLTQGVQITAVQAATYFSQTLDVVAVGRFFGAAPVGLYNRASQVVTLAEGQLTAAITGVTMPVLSRLQDDPERFQRFVERAVRAIGYSLVPLFATLSLVAVPAVGLVYGSQWTEAGRLLVVLALAGTVRSLLLLVELAATALGMMRRQITAALGTQLLSGAALVVAAQHSLTAVAWTYVAFTAISVAAGSWWIARGTAIDLAGAARVFAVPAVLWGSAYLAATAVVRLLGLTDGWSGAFLGVLVELAVAGAGLVLVPRVRTDVGEVVAVVRTGLGRR